MLCARDATGHIIRCNSATNASDKTKAIDQARQVCFQDHPDNCITVGPPFTDLCLAVAVTADDQTSFFGTAKTVPDAQTLALQRCAQINGYTCHVVLADCDASSPTPILSAQSTKPSEPFQHFDVLRLFNLGAIGTGFSFGIGIAVALLIYAMRSQLGNYLIHGNLPQQLPVYGEDIQCLLKRTQRVNWYGRTVFGIVANLAMTHQQLVDIRKYWLGRVVAFDSLRRQRQNQLARMHLQLVASAKPSAKEKTALAQLWTAVKYFLFVLFYLIRALFSFLFGFIFIRVTIARLARGSVIESNDLVLILQAKEAIEQSTTYLKEYLTTAGTFDGGDEVYEPK